MLYPNSCNKIKSIDCCECDRLIIDSDTEPTASVDLRLANRVKGDNIYVCVAEPENRRCYHILFVEVSTPRSRCRGVTPTVHYLGLISCCEPSGNATKLMLT